MAAITPSHACAFLFVWILQQRREKAHVLETSVSPVKGRTLSPDAFAESKVKSLEVVETGLYCPAEGGSCQQRSSSFVMGSEDRSEATRRPFGPSRADIRKSACGPRNHGHFRALC